MPKLMSMTLVTSNSNKKLENSIIYLHMNYSTVIYGWSSSYSLLEELESHQLLIDYQCRAGFCGMCRMKLLSGLIKYSLKPLAYVKHGEILPCCCLPLNNIQLELYNYN